MGTFTNARYLYLICPSNEESPVILPMQRALEKVCAGAISWALDENDPHL
jgi:hypothetical protein